jgi:anti-sigma B factor antagonist
LNCLLLSLKLALTGLIPEPGSQFRQFLGIDLQLASHYHSRQRQRHVRSMSLNIDTREVAHVSILDIEGRIVLGDEIHQLRDAVRGLIAQGKKKIILNLAAVDYIDSSGVGELVGSFTTVRNAGGELKLLNLTQKVHDVLHVTKLYTVFDIKDDEFHAVKSFDYFFAK